jgi:two-component system, NtrC family, nitrogen regulation sensor histidine kinase NtrY
MSYKNFRINIAIRIFLLIVNIFIVVFAVMRGYKITPILLVFLLVYQVYSLYVYIDKVNRNLASFLESIRFNDFTRLFQVEGMGSSFDELTRSFNEVIRDFQKVRSEKEEHFHYLQGILQNIDIGVIAYQKDGTVEMINKAAKKLLQISSLRNICALENLSHELTNMLINIKAGEHALVKIQDEEDILQLAIDATEFKLREKTVMLVTLNNIQSVLEEQETEAWQKLIRVLTHEIMNSITPIASLSATLDQMLKDISARDNDPLSLAKDDVDEIQMALQTINKRSNGLLHFVNTYRNLTRIPKPNFKIITVKSLFENLRVLHDEELRNRNISLQVQVEPENLQCNADEQLIEQVLINLFRNSIHALENRPDARIFLCASYNKRGRVTLQVIDNGPGILKDVVDKIFIPFFTTKPSGSGIGLSLSRQIMRLHNGSITVQSEPEKETTFTLTF